MRSSKKIAAWMLAAAMATGLLAGCGGSSGNETTAAASAADANRPSKRCFTSKLKEAPK